MKQILRFLIYVLLIGFAFAGGYRLTEAWFRTRLVPYPFELYGVAVGLALAFWSFALLQTAELLLSKLTAPKKSTKPYAMKVENRISEVELFK